MLESDSTLRYLEAVVRPRPVARPIHCPQCRGRELAGVEPYRCVGCGAGFGSLAELEVAE